jgi:hypothetical protein
MLPAPASPEALAALQRLVAAALSPVLSALCCAVPHGAVERAVDELLRTLRVLGPLPPFKVSACSPMLDLLAASGGFDLDQAYVECWIVSPLAPCIGSWPMCKPIFRQSMTLALAVVTQLSVACRLTITLRPFLPLAAHPVAGGVPAAAQGAVPGALPRAAPRL